MLAVHTAASARMTALARRRDSRSRLEPENDRNRDQAPHSEGGHAVGAHVAQGHDGWVSHWLLYLPPAIKETATAWALCAVALPIETVRREGENIFWWRPGGDPGIKRKPPKRDGFLKSSYIQRVIWLRG